MSQDYTNEDLFKKIRQIVEHNGESQLFNKSLLRPIEIALKTKQTDPDEGQHISLPFGLKQAIKQDISDNRFILKNFQSYHKLTKSQQSSHQYLSQKNYDNLISLVKGRGEYENKQLNPFAVAYDLEIAICICMYSEDKVMLRRTLAGVGENIVNFVRSGISADKIGVFVIMDGMDMVHPSVVNFFEEMEKESKVFLDDEVEPIGEENLAKSNLDDLDEQEVININQFVFNFRQLKDRQKRRFFQRKKEYQKVKEMLQRIKVQEKDKTITFQTLDEDFKPYFINIARQHYKKQNSLNDAQCKKIKEDFLLETYAYNYKKARPLIQEALISARTFCDQYIATRDSLALLNMFRPPVALRSATVQEQLNNPDYSSVNFDAQDDKNSIKMNLFMVTKYKNSGKLSSHNWFFNGFCKEIKPQYSILLDVGLAPEHDSLVKMYNFMVKKPNVGGVCGYMGLRMERLEDDEQVEQSNIDCVSNLFLSLVDIQRAQVLEYHFAHLVDKPFESAFKFIHVLPGAFSAYRMKALQPHSEGEDSKLIKKYFQSLEESSSFLVESKFGIFQTVFRTIFPDAVYELFYGPPDEKSEERLLYDSNVYLAEDRTLCMGIHENGFDLEYLPDAYAWVDPIKNLHGLLGQRKRWINGSFFAFDSVKQSLNKQSAGECCLRLQIMYLTLMNMLSYIGPALFFFTIHIAMFALKYTILQPVFGSLIPNDKFFDIFVYFMDFIYILSFLTLVFLSMHLTNKNQKFQPYIYAFSTLYGIFAIIIFVVLIVDLIQGIRREIQSAGGQKFMHENIQSNLENIDVLVEILRYIIIGIMALYAIPICIYTVMYKKFSIMVDIVFSAFSFIFYGPTYLNILSLYSLCRIDDISWGTKGLDKTDDNKNKKQMKGTWKQIKFLHVAKFVFWNIFISCVLLKIGGGHADGDFDSRFFLTFGIMGVLTLTLLMKVVIAVVYLSIYRCCLSKKLKLDFTVQRVQSHIDVAFNNVKESMYEQIKQQLFEMTENAKQKGFNIKQLTKKGKTNLLNFVNKEKINDNWKNGIKERSKIVFKPKKRFGKGAQKQKDQGQQKYKEMNQFITPKKETKVELDMSNDPGSSKNLLFTEGEEVKSRQPEVDEKLKFNEQTKKKTNFRRKNNYTKN